MSSLAVELHEREAHVERLSEKLEADLDLAQVCDDGSLPDKAPCFLLCKYTCCTARKGQAFIPSIVAPAPPTSLHLLRLPPPV